MNPFRQTVLLFFFAAIAAVPVRADFSFEQEVSRPKGPVEFTRKVSVTGNVLAMQIERGGELQAEYGFDFEKNLYYEALPAERSYTFYALDALEKGYRQVVSGGPEISRGRKNMAETLSRAVQEGAGDYRIGVRRAFFPRKKIGETPARLYLLSAGPGAFPLNPFGWYWKARVWATRDVPGFQEYARAARRLRDVSDFYKIKINPVSDFVLSAARTDAFPLKAKFKAKRRSGLAYEKDAAVEKTVRVSNRPVERGTLLYWKHAGDFGWHTIFSEGTDFGKDTVVRRAGGVGRRQALGWLLVPAGYAISAYVWFLSGIAGESRFSARRFAAQRAHALLALLLFLQVAHLTADIPYLLSPAFELSLAFGLGCAWIVFEGVRRSREIRELMSRENLRRCRSCGAFIETFYVTCPKCNRPQDQAP